MEQIRSGQDQRPRGEQSQPPAAPSRSADIRRGRRARHGADRLARHLWPRGFRKTSARRPARRWSKLSSSRTSGKKFRDIGFEPIEQGVESVHRASRSRNQALGGVLGRRACGNRCAFDPFSKQPRAHCRAARRRQDLRQRRRSRSTARSRRPRRRIPLAARAVGLRQVDGAAAHRRAERADRAAPSTGASAAQAHRSNIGFVFQEPTLMPWATRVRQCLPAAEARRRRRRRRARRASMECWRASASPASREPIRANCPAA